MSDDLELLAASHRRQIALCAELEEIADSLPSRADPQRCLHLARAVRAIIMEAHELEERALFPRLSTLAFERVAIAASIDRLRWEHCQDECYGEEVCDALYDLARGDPKVGGDTLGYMLRGFFEGMRRHIAFEREVLFPLLSTATSSECGEVSDANASIATKHDHALGAKLGELSRDGF
ncbi:hemerythrin domain-containing protein [Aliihoeflea sp. PC F10.4]